MRLCFIVDARSPIAQNWIRHFSSAGDEVHIISSYPCPPDILPSASFQVVPRMLTGTVKGEDADGVPYPWVSSARVLMGALRPAVSCARAWLLPFDVLRQTARVRSVIAEIEPDLVHAMRVPYEGTLAANALSGVDVPLLVSVWGNDFTLFADRYPTVAWMVRRAMNRADALHPDCQRDLRLAHAWGFDVTKPAIVLPGAGGVQTEVFCPGSAESPLMERLMIQEQGPVVINPRGFRSYVRNDTFFRAIPLVLERMPEALFLGLAMAGNPRAEKWVKELGIGDSLRLLQPVDRNEIAGLFRLADVSVSPSEHDGTPNTLLEAMACGCFPVAGDIESVREWIEDGVNGLLCDPARPKDLAQNVLRALRDSELRQRAGQHNLDLIAKRADYRKVMARAAEFYHYVVESYSLGRD